MSITSRQHSCGPLGILGSRLSSDTIEVTEEVRADAGKHTADFLRDIEALRRKFEMPESAISTIATVYERQLALASEVAIRKQFEMRIADREAKYQAEQAAEVACIAGRGERPPHVPLGQWMPLCPRRVGESEDDHDARITQMYQNYPMDPYAAYRAPGDLTSSLAASLGQVSLDNGAAHARRHRASNPVSRRRSIRWMRSVSR